MIRHLRTVLNFLQSAHLEKKTFFSIRIMNVKSNFRFGGIRSPPVFLDYPSVLLSNKGALILKQRTLFQEKIDSILESLNKQFLV